MTVRCEVRHKSGRSAASPAANFDFDMMHIIGSPLPGHDPRNNSLLTTEDVEADKLPNFACKDAFVGAGIDQRKIANGLLTCWISHDDGYDRPLNAASQLLIGKNHSSRRTYLGCRAPDTR